MTQETLEDSGKLTPTALEEYGILKTAPQKDFDDICLLAAEVTSSPIGILNITDKEDYWIQSSFGIEREQIPFPGFPREHLGNHRILFSDDFDSAHFRKLPQLQNFPFYAGIPLVTEKGYCLGMLFTVDFKAKTLSHNQQAALIILGKQVMELLKYRIQTNEIKKVQRQLHQKYNDLEKFASVVSHDIKSPLANIISLTELLKEENWDSYSEETRQYLEFLVQSSYSLRNYVDGILTFYRSDHILEKQKEDVDLRKLFKGLALLYQINSEVVIHYPASGTLKNINKAALTQIFLNLISNALKYNNKPVRHVEISFQEEEELYVFEVRDNGNGIPEKDLDRIFDLFTTLDSNDRDGNPGSGIGLATVKKMLDHMQGSISVDSAPGEGSNFKIRIRRK